MDSKLDELEFHSKFIQICSRKEYLNFDAPQLFFFPTNLRLQPSFRTTHQTMSLLQIPIPSILVMVQFNLN